MGKIFTILPDVQTEFWVRGIQTFAKRDTYYERGLEIYQSIRNILIRKGLEINKKAFLQKYMKVLLEEGLTAKFLQDSPPNYLMKFAERGGKDGFVHYDGLQEYIEANTLVEALPFDKLDYLFRIYLGLVTAILFLCLAHYFVVQLLISRIKNWLILFIPFH